MSLDPFRMYGSNEFYILNPYLMILFFCPRGGGVEPESSLLLECAPATTYRSGSQLVVRGLVSGGPR